MGWCGIAKLIEYICIYIYIDIDIDIDRYTNEYLYTLPPLIVLYIDFAFAIKDTKVFSSEGKMVKNETQT